MIQQWTDEGYVKQSHFIITYDNWTRTDNRAMPIAVTKWVSAYGSCVAHEPNNDTSVLWDYEFPSLSTRRMAIRASLVSNIPAIGIRPQSVFIGI